MSKKRKKDEEDTESASKKLKKIKQLSQDKIEDESVQGNQVSSEFDELLEPIKRNDPTMTSLTLPYKKIGDAEGVALAGSLKYNHTLTSLTLESNYIGDEGAAALAGSLKVNHTLTILTLHGNYIGDEGAKALAGSLRVNHTLTSLDLAYNSIRDAEGVALAGSLRVNHTLTSLNLRYNKIGNEGAKAFAGSLKDNYTLTSLDIEGNNIIGAEGAGASISIVNLLNRNNNIITKIAKAFAKVDDEIIGSKLNEIEDPRDALAYQKVLKFYQKCSRESLKKEIQEINLTIPFKSLGYYKQYSKEPLGQEKYFKKLFANVDLDIVQNYFKYAGIIRSHKVHSHLAEQGSSGSLWVVKLPTVLMNYILSFLGKDSLWLPTTLISEGLEEREEGTHHSSGGLDFSSSSSNSSLSSHSSFAVSDLDSTHAVHLTGTADYDSENEHSWQCIIL